MTPSKFEWTFALCGAVAVAAACDRRPPAYELPFVTIDRVESLNADRVAIVYHTLPEAQFHSPGVCLERKNGELEVRIVRSYYKSEGDAEVRATALEPYQRRVEIPLTDASAVVLVDDSNRKQIWPHGTAARAANDR